MRFLVDACVDVRVGEWLRNHGHDAVHLREQNRQHLADDDVFAQGISEDRIVLTFDLGFGEIAAATRGALGTVIVVRLRNTRWSHVVQRLETVLQDASADLSGAVIVTIEESRYRVRRLPIGAP